MRLEWKPIESAPRDGKPILIVYEAISGKRVCEAYFDDGKWQTSSVRVDDPTHWHPMPKPPRG